MIILSIEVMRSGVDEVGPRVVGLKGLIWMGSDSGTGLRLNIPKNLDVKIQSSLPHRSPSPLTLHLSLLITINLIRLYPIALGINSQIMTSTRPLPLNCIFSLLTNVHVMTTASPLSLRHDFKLNLLQTLTPIFYNQLILALIVLFV